MSDEVMARLASFYADDPHPWGTEPLSVVVEHVEAFRPGVVLDLGGGDGRNALFLAEHGFEVTVVDVVPRALETLARASEERGLAIDSELHDLAGYAPPPHDNLVCTLTFHFLLEEDARRLLADTQAATRPGGVHVLTTFTRDGPLFGQSSDGRFWLAPSELATLYAGWDVLHTGRRTVETAVRDEDGRPYLQPMDELVARKPA
jgi:tellurite methyltransferase